MAPITDRRPGGAFPRLFLPPTAAGEKGRQVGKVFRGGKKAVRADVAEWEASLRGTTPGTVGPDQLFTVEAQPVLGRLSVSQKHGSELPL